MFELNSWGRHNLLYFDCVAEDSRPDGLQLSRYEWRGNTAVVQKIRDVSLSAWVAMVPLDARWSGCPDCVTPTWREFASGAASAASRVEGRCAQSHGPCDLPAGFDAALRGPQRHNCANQVSSQAAQISYLFGITRKPVAEPIALAYTYRRWFLLESCRS